MTTRATGSAPTATRTGSSTRTASCGGASRASTTCLSGRRTANTAGPWAGGRTIIRACQNSDFEAAPNRHPMNARDIKKRLRLLADKEKARVLQGFFKTGPGQYDETKEHHILSPSPIIMSGLTRKERQLKQLLFMALDQLHSSKNPSEIRYWYTEWNP